MRESVPQKEAALLSIRSNIVYLLLLVRNKSLSQADTHGEGN